MRNVRHTAISVGLALAVATLLIMAGLSSGFAMMIGAAAGIVYSVVTQRRSEAINAGPLGGSEEPADIEAAYTTAGETIQGMPTQVAAITDESTRQLATRITDLFDQILRNIDEHQARGVAPLLVDQLIEPAEALLTDYLWLQKRPESTARDAMSKISLRDLPAAELAARQVVAVLERPGTVDIAALRRAVDFQFSFGGETTVVTAEMWGNREAVVRTAERNP